MAQIDDIEVTRAILERFGREMGGALNVDVVIGGAGPAGLVAGQRLAERGLKVTIFERKLAPGGGMWGGGMTFPVIVVQEASLPILKGAGIRVERTKKGYYTADSVEAVAKLCAGAIDAGVRIYNAVSIEDVVFRKGRIGGVVINWSAVEIAGMHVDPLSIGSRAVVDATGHAAEICKVTQRKAGELRTPSGNLEGEKSMWAEVGERTVVENTREVFPGLYVAGMAANAVYGAPRMGPIFGGMLLSGERCAQLIVRDLKKR
ncbi:MAG: thiazole biosynthesis protein [Euryarchaeota archaeon]|nr:thiazole biosynthesis protein [Euryarchaeota archaeon]